MATVGQDRGEQQVVVFELAHERYGVEIGCVQEIIRPPAITSVPRAPAYVEGVINLRGRVIPVIDLGRRFGLAATQRGRSARIVVLEVSGEMVGLVVDAVSEVVRVHRDAIEPPGATLAGPLSAHLRGIAKLDERLIILLDLERALAAAG